MSELVSTPVGAGGFLLQTRLTVNEAGKGLRLMWRRRSMTVVGIVMTAVMYLGVVFFIGGGHLVDELMVLTVPAMLAVAVAETAAIQGSGGVAEEINGGTLEQTQMSPAPPYVQVIGRMAALAVEGMAAAAVLGLGFVLGFGLDYELRAAAIVPAVVTILDALGYGLLIVAFTVRVASIGAITHVFNMVIMFFGGMIVPITVFPDPLETIAQLVPTALGVQAFNTVMSGETLATIWSDGTLPGLLVHASALIAAGLASYVANIHRARREGALSP